MKNYTNTVRTLLERVPVTRDNDMRLLAYVWAETIGYEKIKEISCHTLFDLMADGKIPSPETIRRARQRLQQQNPNLRGKNYGSKKFHTYGN